MKPGEDYRTRHFIISLMLSAAFLSTGLYLRFSPSYSNNFGHFLLTGALLNAGVYYAIWTLSFFFNATCEENGRIRQDIQARSFPSFCSIQAFALLLSFIGAFGCLSAYICYNLHRNSPKVVRISRKMLSLLAMPNGRMVCYCAYIVGGGLCLYTSMVLVVSCFSLSLN